MIEAGVDTSQLNKLVEKLGSSPEVIQQAKQKAIQAAAPKLKQTVDAEIGGTGKVRRWQEQYIGSKGGYAAVRPKAKTYADQKKRYAVGYVTNAINSGHRFPTPTGKNRRYRARIKSGHMKVSGKHFYESAQAQVPQIAQEAAQQVVDALIKHMEV